jgi:hypothetical protein
MSDTYTATQTFLSTWLAASICFGTIAVFIEGARQANASLKLRHSDT